MMVTGSLEDMALALQESFSAIPGLRSWWGPESVAAQSDCGMRAEFTAQDWADWYARLPGYYTLGQLRERIAPPQILHWGWCSCLGAFCPVCEFLWTAGQRS